MEKKREIYEFKKFLLLLITLCNTNAHKASINVAYYELQPFIYKGENGSLLGILPDLAAQLKVRRNVSMMLEKHDGGYEVMSHDEKDEVCGIEINFKLDMKSAKNFSAFMAQKDKMKRYFNDSWLWLPLTRHIKETNIRKLNFESIPFAEANMDVVVHKNRIKIFVKIKAGLFECRYLFVIGFILALIFGVVIWFIERWKNEDIPKCPGGIFTGVWLALVTMTTVGYGDVTPKSFLGRILTMAWMVTGILLSAILTSTMTNVFEDVDYMNIRNKKVVAVRGSLEAYVARRDFNAEVIKVPDYASLYDTVARNVLYTGVVNSDVHWYFQDKYKDFLGTVKRLESDMDMQVFYPDLENEDYYDLHHCLIHPEIQEMIENTFANHKGVTRKVKLQMDEKVVDFIFDNPTILTFATIATVLIFLGVVLECIWHLYNFFRVKSSTAVSDVKLQTQLGSNKGNENKRQIMLHMEDAVLKDDINELKTKIDVFNNNLESINIAVEYLKNNVHTK